MERREKLPRKRPLSLQIDLTRFADRRRRKSQMCIRDRSNTTSTLTVSSREGFLRCTTASKRMTTTGMAYCKTMALAALVSLFAKTNSTDVPITPNAPSQVPKVLVGR